MQITKAIDTGAAGEFGKDVLEFGFALELDLSKYLGGTRVFFYRGLADLFEIWEAIRAVFAWTQRSRRCSLRSSPRGCASVARSRRRCSAARSPLR